MCALDQYMMRASNGANREENRFREPFKQNLNLLIRVSTPH